MRIWKKEAELKEIAHKLSGRIFENERWRDTTTAEADKLYNIFYPALLTLNYYHSSQGEYGRGLDDGVINAAEYAGIAQFGRRPDKVNSYVTIYCPLRRVVRDWETE